jgi:hypothetical protein
MPYRLALLENAALEIDHRSSAYSLSMSITDFTSIASAMRDR